MNQTYFITRNKTDKLGPISCASLTIEQVRTGVPKDANAFIIDTADQEEALEAFRVIRQNASPAVYLRPIVVISSRQSISPLFQSLADAELVYADINEFSYRKMLDTVMPFNNRIEMLPEYQTLVDVNIAFKIIRYLYARSASLAPVRGIDSKFGLSYPQLDIFMSKTDESAYSIISFLENQKLLAGIFYEKAHFCGECECAFLNFQEICPHCRSTHLDVQDHLHHYPCAYIGPEKDFIKNGGGQAVCPKCTKELKQIGVDYDKPSIIYLCNNCAHTFQEPDITTVCYNCGKESSPEGLTFRSIKRYNLTALAENSAVYGLESLFRQMFEDKMLLISYDAFKIYLGYEIARIRRYKISKTCVAIFQITDMDKLYIQHGKKVRQIYEELGSIFNARIRSSDVITTLNDSIFLFMLTETPEDGATTLLSILVKQVEELFSGSIDFPAKLFTKAIEIDDTNTVDSLIEEIISHADTE